jgi:hypothetical protein
MKIGIALSVAALALTAGAAANAAAQPNAAPPVSTTPPAGSGAPVDRAWLVGKWGIVGDCSQVMEFRADGTVTEPPAQNGTYTISGSTVSVNIPGRAPDPADVTRTGDDTMAVRPPTGGPAQSMQRCR